MSEVERLLGLYVKAVAFPEVSGFEVLELLDVRSRVAAQESELDAAGRARLEEADTLFLRHAPKFHQSVAALGDLGDLRRRASAPCSHWWWYLEKLAQRDTVRT